MFDNLIAQLRRDLPWEPLTRLVNLAAVAVGMQRSKSLQLGQIVTALPLDGTRDTLKKRVQRFVKTVNRVSSIFLLTRTNIRVPPGIRRTGY